MLLLLLLLLRRWTISDLGQSAPYLNTTWTNRTSGLCNGGNGQTLTAHLAMLATNI
jgi:hypothetical protein